VKKGPKEKRKKQQQQRKRSKIKTMTNSVKPETSIVRFKFHQKVYHGIKITDSKDIEMIWGKVEKDALTWFQITNEKSNHKKIIKASEQIAPRLTNIPSSITGIEITHKDPTQIKIIRNGKTYSHLEKTYKFSYLKPISLDSIDLTKLCSLLTKSSKLYMQLGHAHNGHRAFFNEDYPQAIREFFLISNTLAV
jgi:hypothetical protein